MSEENTAQVSGDQNSGTNVSTEAENKNAPYNRFSEVNAQKNDALKQVQNLQSQIDKLNQANKTAQEEELAKQGEYKTLLENTQKERDGLKIKAEEWDSYKATKRSALMEKLTDDVDRDIAEGLSLTKLEKYVDHRVLKNNVPSTSQARAGNGKADEFGGYSSAMEWVTKDPDSYEKSKQKDSGGKFGNIFAPRQNPFADGQ